MKLYQLPVSQWPLTDALVVMVLSTIVCAIVFDLFTLEDEMDSDETSQTDQTNVCDRCGEPTSGRLYPIKDKDGKVVEYVCSICYDGV